MPTTPADLTRVALGRLDANYNLPANPALIVARMSSDSLAYTPNVVESPELDPSGQLVEDVFVGSSSAGGIEFPMVRSTFFHEMLAAVFRNEWGTGMIADQTAPGVFSAPRAVGPDELIPGKLVHMYDVEKTYATPTGSKYHWYHRNGVATMALRVTPNAVLTGTVTLAGANMDPGDTGVPGATYPDPGEYKLMTSPQVTEMAIAGITAPQCFNTLTLTFNSNLRGVPCVGEESDREKALGRFIPTFDGTTYFVDNEHILALKSQAEMQITITLTDGSGNSYTFFYPRASFITAPVVTPGTNQDVMQPISMRGKYHKTLGYSCLVTRVLAAP